MTSEQQPKAAAMREIELLWGIRQAPKRGPKPKLTLRAVVDAAVGVADAEGLENVSMQRVAKELGYTTMSLYRYVDSKDDLLLLMTDAVMDGDPPAPADDWRAGVEAWFHGAVALYREHPWVVYLPTTGPPSGPNNLRWMEAGLRELYASGLAPGEALQTLLFLSSIARESLRMELETSPASAAGGQEGEPEGSWAQGLLAVTDEATYPAVRRLLTASFEEHWWDEDESMEVNLVFPLRRVLDGIESHVAARAADGSEERR